MHVPTHLFKAVLVEQPDGSQRAVAGSPTYRKGLSRLRPLLLGFIMPNKPIDEEQSLQAYQVKALVLLGSRSAAHLFYP